MSHTARTIRKRWFGHRPNDWQTYHALIAEHVRSGFDVLDIGCGTGATNPFPWHEYPDVKVRGIDPDERAAVNPALCSFALLEDSERWPVEDDSVDLALARYVLEHVEDPESFFRNLQRVLRPGGLAYFCVPFLQGYHPAHQGDADYWRFTLAGLEQLCRRFERVESGVAAGPNLTKADEALPLRSSSSRKAAISGIASTAIRSASTSIAAPTTEFLLATSLSSVTVAEGGR